MYRDLERVDSWINTLKQFYYNNNNYNNEWINKHTHIINAIIIWRHLLYTGGCGLSEKEWKMFQIILLYYQLQFLSCNDNDNHLMLG